MPTQPPPERSVATELQRQAAYWLAHATSLARQYADAPGLTAFIGRQRARQAFGYYGRALANIERHRAGLWL